MCGGFGEAAHSRAYRCILVTASPLTLPLVECPCLLSLLPESTQWCLIRVCEINGFLGRKPWFKKQENGRKGGENQYSWEGEGISEGLLFIQL